MGTKPDFSIFSTVTELINPFKNSEKLAEALQISDSKAIAYVLEKTTGSVKNLLRSMGLPVEKYRDFQHDGILILIDKIQNKAFNSQTAAPTTFLVGICKYLILNYLRAKKVLKYEDLAADFELIDHDVAFYQSTKEMSEMLDILLEKLGAPCKDLIRLKYLDGFRDEEIIEQKMTHFGSSDSLRNSRSQCMKKLTEMARQTNKN